MKKLILLFTATTLVLGAVCFIQWQRLERQGSDAAILRNEVERQDAQIAGLEESYRAVQKQRDEGWVQAGDLAMKLQSRMFADANPKPKPADADSEPIETVAADKNPMGGFFTKMMEDPEMKKMIRQQQRMMLDQLYDPFIRRMQLTPEQAEGFKNLLADNMMKGAEKASSLFGGSSTDRSETVNALGEEQKAFEQQLRDYLGESGYAQYEEYQQTVGERMQLSQFQLQTAGSGDALSEQQIEGLLRLMSEEKRSATAAGELLPGDARDAANFEALLSGNGLDQILKAQEGINQRVYDRAVGVLSETQLSAFGKFQTNQLQMMRFGMDMARKFMAPENDSAAP